MPQYRYSFGRPIQVHLASPADNKGQVFPEDSGTETANKKPAQGGFSNSYGGCSLSSKVLILWPRRILGEPLSFVSRSVQPQQSLERLE